MSYCRWYLSSVTAYLVSSPGKFLYVSSNTGGVDCCAFSTPSIPKFCYVLANCLEWSDSRFSYSQQLKFCYVSSNAVGVDRHSFSNPSSQNLLCISKLPGVEQLALFLLTAAQILLYIIQRRLGDSSCFFYSQEPKFVIHHPTPVGWIVALFLIPVAKILLCISKLPGVERLLLFLLTAAQILFCISNLPGVEQLVGLFLLPVPQICYISFNANSLQFLYSQEPKFVMYHPTAVGWSTQNVLPLKIWWYLVVQIVHWSTAFFPANPIKI
jgi:hypothetical protein